MLGILPAINRRCPKHPLNLVSDAECVLALILNVLCGRPALYRMDEWLGRLDMGVLFNEGVESSYFHDNRLASALDHIDAVGTDTLLSDIASAYLAADDEPRAFPVHHDTTSVLLFGAYEGKTDPTPAYGFSKDHRPDLKQLIYGLTMHGAIGMPLVCTVVDGNTSDQAAARDHLARLTKLLPDEHEVTLVGDCKLVEAHTLGRILRAGLHFVTLVPNTYAVRRELIETAWKERPEVEDWPVLAERSGRRKADPTERYRGWSYERPFRTYLEDANGEGPKSMEDLRFEVVYSDALAKKFDAALPRRMEKEVERLTKAASRVGRKGFLCETDATRAATELAAKAKYHNVSVALLSDVRPVKRDRPGRPRKDEVRQTITLWRFKLVFARDDERIAALRRCRSCFVLVTDWLMDSWDDERVLREYRHEKTIEGHQGFRWLKGPAAVAPVFLKTPSRIRAMGFVLMLGLMVRNYMQSVIRDQLAARGETLLHPFTRKKVPYLTTEMAFEHFAATFTQVVNIEDEHHRMPVKLRPMAVKILDLFGLDESIFEPMPPGGRELTAVRWGNAGT